MGNLGVAGCLSIFRLFQSCTTDCSWHTQLFPNLYRKRVKRLFILLNFCFSAFSQCDICYQRFERHRLGVPTGGCLFLFENSSVHQGREASAVRGCRHCPSFSTSGTRTWIEVNIHPALNVLIETMRLPDWLVWIKWKWRHIPANKQLLGSRS